MPDSPSAGRPSPAAIARAVQAVRKQLSGKTLDVWVHVVDATTGAPLYAAVAVEDVRLDDMVTFTHKVGDITGTES